jgi:hypothetical protein
LVKRGEKSVESLLWEKNADLRVCERFTALIGSETKTVVMKNIKLLILLSLPMLAGCQKKSPPPPPEPPYWTATEIATPCKSGGEPNLVTSWEGGFFLNWVEYVNDTTDALRFSTLTEADVWSEPKEVARGSNWFVNWADFPSLAVYPGTKKQGLAAHWLAKSAGGDYDYEVRIAQSADGGTTWSPSFVPHTNNPAEYGFVSLLPLDSRRMMGVWLDGRHTKTMSATATHGGHDGHGGGPMSLHTAVFNPQGQLQDDAELDARICDCCQTDAALSDLGPVVVYRDRSEKEIRDISIIRLNNGKWTSPKPVATDNWHITGCPVNGPAIDALANKVVVAWYTGAPKPQVKVAFSEDSGANFSAPIVIDDAKPLGRVDVAWTSWGEAVVSWMKEKGKDADIQVQRVAPNGKQGTPFMAASTSSARGSGFPILARLGSDMWIAYTAGEEKMVVKTVRLRRN